MVTQFESGALDSVKSPPLTDFHRLKTNNKFQALAFQGSGIIYCIGMNVTTAPFDNKLARQALSYAIDRKRFAETVMGGIGRPQSLPWLQASPAYEASKENFYTFDLDKAKSLFAQAGVKEFSMDWLLVGTPEGTAMAQIIQADLAKIGVKFNIKLLEPAIWGNDVRAQKYVGGYWANSTRSNLLPATMLSSSRLSDPLGNNSGFTDPTYTKLVADAAVETDATKLKQIYSQLNDVLLDSAFAIFVSPAPPTMLATAKLKNVTTEPFGGFSYATAWLDA
jgi:peptide/nickel transport system substrate-binding protein